MRRVVVILPVHNEAWLIGSVLGQVTDFAREYPDWRFLFVDDGSTDDTAQLIEDHISKIKEKHGSSNLELLRQLPNAGKATAIRNAVSKAHEELVCFTDGDLAYPLDHLTRLVTALDDCDVAIGSRALANIPQGNITTVRRFVGTAFNRLVRLVTGLPFRDTQAGLKGFRNEPAQILFREQVINDFAFDAELLFLAKRLGMRIKEIPAHVSQRHSYKKSRVNMLRDPFRMLYSLIRMRFVHRGIRSRLPAYEPQRTQPLQVEVHIEPNASMPKSQQERATSEV